MSYGYCERCNWRCDADDFRKEWSGLRVCPDCFDPRPAQLSPPNVKPEGLPLLNASPEVEFSGAGSKTYDWPSIAAKGTATTTVTVTGASIGDGVNYAADMSNGWSGLIASAEATGSNTVTVSAYNPSGGAIDLDEGTLTVTAVEV